MPVPHGWSAAQWEASKAAVAASNDWLLSVRVMDLSHNHLATLPPNGMDGQVNLDATADVDRTLQFEAVDAGGQLAALMAPDVAPRHLIQVHHGTRVGGSVLWTPVFTGRPSLIEDTTPSVSITALGKECLHLRGVPSSVIKKGTYVVTAIAAGLKAAGETRILIPKPNVLSARVLRDTPIGGSDEDRQPWKVWKKLADGAGYHLFHDGAGYATIRTNPTPADITFEWDARTVLSVPALTTDMSELKNRWHGYGAGNIQADVIATGDYSPANLAINGVSWSDIEYEAQNTSLTTTTLAQARGKKRILQLISVSTDATFDAVPFHAVAPRDYCRVTTPDRSAAFPIRTASIPLVGAAGDRAGEGWPMTIGYQKKVRHGGVGYIRVSGRYVPPRKKKR